ncbi:hypothetical protein U1Q18_017899 [Sarracenia purpurea var. burkii]
MYNQEKSGVSGMCTRVCVVHQACQRLCVVRVWNRIIWVWDEFYKVTSFEVGNGHEERFSCKDQEISENFYVRGDGTRAFYFSMEFLMTLFNESGFDNEDCGLCCKRVENRSREIVMNRRWVQAAFRLNDATYLSCTKSGNEVPLYCKEGSIPELKEIILEEPVNDYQIDMSEGMGVEMFGISISNDEVMD